MRDNIGISYTPSTGHSYAPARKTPKMEKTVLDRALEALADADRPATQKEIGRIVGIAQSSVSLWRNGGPKLENAITFCKKVGVCVEWLYTGRGPKYAPPADSLTDELLTAWAGLPPDLKSQLVGFAKGLKPPRPKGNSNVA